ncbi:uncharacterized protein [Ptychodera flava]|uniref:uncharacterized protein n=1 Tax=Ptychodera flava TaxID=63121 RepID=UPI00396A8AAD
MATCVRRLQQFGRRYLLLVIAFSACNSLVLLIWTNSGFSGQQTKTLYPWQRPLLRAFHKRAIPTVRSLIVHRLENEPVGMGSRNRILLKRTLDFDKLEYIISNYAVYISQNPDFFLINADKRCWQEQPVFLLVFVVSSPEEGALRNSVRDTWVRTATIADKPIVVLFMLGLSRDHATEELLLEESAEYNDIVQGDFIDAPENESIKTISMFHWVKRHCDNLQYFLRTDVRSIVLTQNLLDYLSHAPKTNFASGRARIGTQPVRNPKSQWFVSADQWAKPSYPAYMEGPSYLLSGDLVVHGAAESVTIPTFVFEDVYVGIILERLNVTITDNPSFDIHGSRRKMCDLRKLFVSGKFTEDNDMLERYWHGIQTLDGALCDRSQSESALWSSIFGNTTNLEKSVNYLNYSFPVNHPTICTLDDNPEKFGQEVFLLLITPSSATKQKEREVIRNTRGKRSEFLGKKIVQIFLIGRTTSSSTDRQIMNENNRYKDIVVVDIMDNYKNLTLKTVMLLKWATFYCPNARYVMKVDDDVFINLHNLVSILVAAPRSRHVVAYVHKDSKPLRDPKYKKWYVTYDEWPYDTYPPYPNGPGYVMSYDVARDVFLSAHRMKFFRFEDVYVGINLQSIGVQPTHHAGFDSFGKKRTLCELKEAVTTHWVHEDKMYQFWRELNEWGEFVVCEGASSTDPKKIDNIVIDQGRVIGMNVQQNGSIPGIILDHPEKCAKTENSAADVFMVVCVMTNPSNFNMRKSIRETWGMYGKSVKQYRFETLFFVGLPTDDRMQRKIEAENKKFEDIIQYNFHESYEHLVLKTLAMLQWVTHRCSGAAYFTKVDDDVFLSYENLADFVKDAPKRDLYLGEVRIGTGPSHTETYKWYTPRDIWPSKTYPPYISGPSYVMSMDLVTRAYEMSKRVKIFKWEDVYVGTLVTKLDVAPYPHIHYDLYGLYRTPCTLQAAIVSHHFTAEMNRKYWKLLQEDVKKESCINPYLDKIEPKFIDLPLGAKTFAISGRDDIVADDNFWTAHPRCRHHESQGSPVFLVILVFSKADRYDNRRYSRIVWANKELILGRRVLVQFVMSDHQRKSYHTTLLHEDELNRDVMLSRVYEDKNDSLIHMQSYEWVLKHCQSAKYIMKIEDDVFVNVEKVVAHLVEAPTHGYVTGQVVTDLKPDRQPESVFYVSETEWSENVYPPHCNKAFCIMSMDIVGKVIARSRPTTLFKFADVHLGIMLREIGVLPIHTDDFDSKGVSGTDDKNGVCGLQSVLAAKGFTGQTMLYISKNVLDGTFMNCDLDTQPRQEPNDDESIPINPPAREIDITLNGKFANRTVINKHSYSYLINHPDRCTRHREKLTLLVLIVSVANEESFRNAIRSAWANDRNIGDAIVDYVFLLGTPDKSETHFTEDLIRKEDSKHGDIIMANFVDTGDFGNMTLKTIMALKWAALYCQNAKYLMKTRVTTYVQTTNIANFLTNSFVKETNLVIGHVLQESRPIRNPNSSFYTPKEIFPESRYPPYPEGRGFLFSSDVAYKAYVASLYVKLFPWEDVYFGLLLRELAIVPHRHSDFLVYPISGVPDVCYMRNSFTWNANSPRTLTQSYEKLQSSVNVSCFENLVKPNDYDFIINAESRCQNVSGRLDLVAVVMTSAQHFGRRRAVRETWALPHKQRDFTMVHVFFVGKTHDDDVQTKLIMENEEHGDIVQCSFHDTYSNLTLKTAMMLKWTSKHCKEASYVMKVDDDVLVNIDNVIASLREAPTTEYSWGRTYYSQSPVRDPKHKNYTPLDLWPDRPFPPYNAGPCYFMSGDVVQTLHRASFDSKRFVNEDVYVGILLQKIGVYPKRDTRFDIAGSFRALCEVRDIIATHKLHAHELYRFWYRLHAEQDVACENDEQARDLTPFYYRETVTVQNEYTFLNDQSEFCSKMTSPGLDLLVILICSLPKNFGERRAIRETWGRTYQREGVKIAPLFILGKTANLSQMAEVLKESREWDDIILVDFQDGTQYSTFKTIAILQWATKFCSDALYVMRTDDGTFLNYENLISYIKDTAPRTQLIAGGVLRGSGPIRDLRSEYYTPKEVWPHHFFPTYVEGPTYIMSIDVVQELESVSQTRSPIMWEDVYIGVLLQKLRISPTEVDGFDLSARKRGNCENKDSIVTRFLTAPQMFRFWRENRYATISC